MGQWWGAESQLEPIKFFPGAQSAGTGSYSLCTAAVQYSAVQRSAVQYSAMYNSAVQCSAVEPTAYCAVELWDDPPQGISCNGSLECLSLFSQTSTSARPLKGPLHHAFRAIRTYLACIHIFPAVYMYAFPNLCLYDKNFDFRITQFVQKCPLLQQNSSKQKI